jgi:PKD repeat protein
MRILTALDIITNYYTQKSFIFNVSLKKRLWGMGLRELSIMLIFILIFPMFLTLVPLVNSQTFDDWPMFQHDTSQSGISNSLGPSTNQLIWVDDQMSCSTQACIVNGIVYVGSTDGKLYALNSTSGAEIWNFKTGYGQVRSTPCITGGVLYFGSQDGNVYALNATTGLIIWVFSGPIRFFDGDVCV